MRRAVPIIIALAIVGGFAWTLRFLYMESEREPVVYETRTPEIADIEVVTVATGALVPRQEIEIKPRVSGVIETLWIEPGQVIERGTKLAKIRIIPDVVRLNQAESQVELARLALTNAARELDRHRGLHDKQVISQTELARFQHEHDLRTQELANARQNLQLIREGASRKAGVASNVVTSTVAGTVLEVPVEVGASVIESNTFNAGTTVATVADMSDMIFKGKVDESEVGKIREGMPLDIKIGALEGTRLRGALEHIAPKGVAEEGVIKFEIRAAITPPEPGGEAASLRANYSANANIVLARREQVLTIAESLLQFEGGKPYVEVEVAPQEFERRDVEVGLSDGIRIEVLSGIDANVRIKKFQGTRDGERRARPRRRPRS